MAGPGLGPRCFFKEQECTVNQLGLEIAKAGTCGNCILSKSLGFFQVQQSHEDGGTNTDLICFLSHCGDCVRGREERRQKWMLGSW